MMSVVDLQPVRLPSEIKCQECSEPFALEVECKPTFDRATNVIALALAPADLEAALSPLIAHVVERHERTPDAAQLSAWIHTQVQAQLAEQHEVLSEGVRILMEALHCFLAQMREKQRVPTKAKRARRYRAGLA